MDKKILLHICCGVCAIHPVEKLKAEGFLISGYFYNPNIYPSEEYRLRKDAAQKIAKLYQIELLESEYETALWKEKCAKLAEEKEGGKRCNFCFQLRLAKANQKAKNKRFNYFTTTLTISPHKKSQDILQIGKRIGGQRFLSLDFKKEDGFKKTLEKAKKIKLYRQNYCGCLPSRTTPPAVNLGG